ncbi:MAG: phosphoglycerate mutase family protein [Turicibacter sp.]|nr:phosphoglycerate mutase family protein [Turicibacter sp.]
MICYLVRHGKDDDSVRGGWSNSDITEEGITQVINLVDYIVKKKNELKIERLFSSDLPRAVQTVEPISVALGIKIEYKAEFRETNNGLLAGMPNNIAEEKYPGLYWNSLKWDESYPQGESPRGFYERIKVAWEQFSNMVLRNNQNVILVSHSGVINVIYTLIDGTSFSTKTNESVPYATMIPLKFSNGVWIR